MRRWALGLGRSQAGKERAKPPHHLYDFVMRASSSFGVLETIGAARLTLRHWPGRVCSGTDGLGNDGGLRSLLVRRTTPNN